MKVGPKKAGTSATLAGPAVALAAVALAGCAGAPSAISASPCAAGRWVDPKARTVIAEDRLIGEMARRPVVLLGEEHTSAEQHRWQLDTLAALHGRRPEMVLGFEMFARSAQPVLDRWVGGELNAAEFLKEVRWEENWGYPAELYLPLFQFARRHRVPMRALNVERGLVRRVGREGWDAVPENEREGTSTPLPASPAYRRFLAEIFAGEGAHRRGVTQKGGEGSPAAEPPPTVRTEDPAFRRFVEAQLLWDRAMAEALAAAARGSGGPLVVGILGRSHVAHRWGVVEQLADLGILDAAVLLTLPPSADCAGLTAGLADAVFILEPREEDAPPSPPRLGVMIETAAGGVRVTRVLEGSVAAAAGLEKGDVIVSAAGTRVADGGELIAIVRRQAPGSWLPLMVRRGPHTIQRVARFPPAGGPNR